VSRFLRPATLVLVLSTGVLLWPAAADAQRHAHPRVVRPVVVHGGYYGPSYYRPYFYAPFYWGVYGWYPYPFGPYPPYPYYWGGYDPASSVRVLVEPKEAQVYVDGYFVGLVDDFDGWSQRLRLVPGEHEIAFYLEGYRPVHEKLLFRPSAGYKLRHALEKLAPGEPMPPRPEPAPGAPQAAPPRPPDEQPAYERAEPPGGEAPPEANEFGTLALRVQPDDAAVQIDGERWDGPLGGSRLQVQLAQGRHRLVVSKEGYRSYVADIEVRAGEVTTLNVSLPKN
jgi:hypothetical protein